MVLLLEVGSHQGESAKYINTVLLCKGPHCAMKYGLHQTSSSRSGSLVVEPIVVAFKHYGFDLFLKEEA